MANVYVTALTIGLLGSIHCIGMCGGIVGALNAGFTEEQQSSKIFQALHHLAYNFGRILSYAMAGAAIGLIGAEASKFNLVTTISVGNLIAGLFMIALGLYLAGWWQALAVLEKAGVHVWRWIEPFGRRFLPVRTPMHALGLGLIWGWLPCGLVYAALTLSMSAKTPTEGALIMMSFGAGTLPVLLALGNVAGQIRALARHPITRQIAGGSIIVFGLYSCVTAFNENAHDHAAHAKMTTEGIAFIR